MKRDPARKLIDDVERLASQGLTWHDFAARVGELLRRAIAFDRTCWHSVDPGTCMLTGSLGLNIECSGTWLAQHEFVIDDINQWRTLARAERKVAALSSTTQGDLDRCIRVRTSREFGAPVGDELRVAFVANGTYWGAAGFLRDPKRPVFTDEEVRILELVSEPIADGFRRALLVQVDEAMARETAPGIVLFDEHGRVVALSPAAEELIAQIPEQPRPASPGDSYVVQSIAARARRIAQGSTTEPPPSARVRTHRGDWLRLYATPLAGEHASHLAVMIQPAGLHDIVPLVARAYELTEQERRITRLCLEGRSTRQISSALEISEYTVQDHLKAIFRKTGTSSRGELVGQVFLEHYVTRYEEIEAAPGWTAQAIPKS